MLEILVVCHCQPIKHIRNSISLNAHAPEVHKTRGSEGLVHDFLFDQKDESRNTENGIIYARLELELENVSECTAELESNLKVPIIVKRASATTEQANKSKHTAKVT